MNNQNFQLTNNKKTSQLAFISLLVGIGLFLIGIILLIFLVNSHKKTFPNNTQIGLTDVSLLTPNEAKEKISSELAINEPFTLTIQKGENKVSTTSSEIDYEFLIDKSIKDGFEQIQKNLTFLKPLKLYQVLFTPNSFELQKQFNEEKIASLSAELAERVDTKGHVPFATLKYTGQSNSIEIDPGKKGLEINQPKLIERIKQQLRNKNQANDEVFEVDVEEAHYELTDEQLSQAQKLSEKYVSKKLQLLNKNYKDIRPVINDQELVGLLQFPEGVNEERLSQVVNQINENIKRDSKNAIFDYETDKNGKITVNEFSPHHDGLEINKADLQKKLAEIIKEIGNDQHVEENIEVDLPLEVVKPDITLEETNDLGIKELIGFGDSEYDHSIPNRIWNVSLTAEKMNNIVVAPGEEFRFNSTLGEVSRRTGYRSAYVISGGKTILGDGGGVCQVSTTYFRAVLDAGLNITLRKPHSYRVSYYELNQKPGIDATVYAGDVDFRFLNDTDHHILITASADPDDLYMNVAIYGTSDGRTTEITDHKTWDLRSPPAPAYYPTTDIPSGTIKQIDWSVSGIKASFKHIIRNKDGEVINEKEYYSNYVPWSAKYLQGI